MNKCRESIELGATVCQILQLQLSRYTSSHIFSTPTKKAIYLKYPRETDNSGFTIYPARITKVGESTGEFKSVPLRTS